jgi:hypothetical protein
MSYFLDQFHQPTSIPKGKDKAYEITFLSVCLSSQLTFETWFKILVRRPAIQTERLRGFPHSLQANTGIVPQIKPRPLPSTSFPIRHSPIILSFDVIQYELLRERR